MSAETWYKIQLFFHNLGFRSYPWVALTAMRVEKAEKRTL